LAMVHYLQKTGVKKKELSFYAGKVGERRELGKGMREKEKTYLRTSIPLCSNQDS